MIAAVALTLLMSTGCIRQNYIMFEDGDFDGMEFSDYDLMQNAELDMDDADRDWKKPISIFSLFLKIINWHEGLIVRGLAWLVLADLSLFVVFLTSA